MKENLIVKSWFTEEDLEQRKYNQREKAIRDYESAMSAMLSEGKMKGRIEGRIEAAMAMLNDGFSAEKVMRYTQLSKEEMNRLLRSEEENKII